MSISSFFQFPDKLVNKNKKDPLADRIKILEEEIEVLKKMNRKLNFSIDLLMSESLKNSSKNENLKKVS